MPGSLPQNAGNKSALRVGPGVTRRLRQGGINVSPAAAKHHRPGIYVSARGLHISVFVDLGTPERVREAAQDIARVITSWGLAPAVSEKTHADGGTTATVSFTHPAPKPPAPKSQTAATGRAAPVDETAAPEGMEWMRVQATTVTATLASAGYWSSHGVTVDQATTTAVVVRIADDAPDDLREGVSKALHRKKYTVEPSGDGLTVRKLKKAKRS
jgi:hypothetical protein